MAGYAGPFHGSKTTRIFCLPTCRYDRRVLERNRAFFASTEEAFAAKFRPCKVCRPLDAASDAGARPGAEAKP
jgi:AraC family transcriptional regulator, regulatory protein of adaptative response / methylated-DNA-[protein]-cysteine methyltransferase